MGSLNMALKRQNRVYKLLIFATAFLKYFLTLWHRSLPLISSFLKSIIRQISSSIDNSKVKITTVYKRSEISINSTISTSSRSLKSVRASIQSLPESVKSGIERSTPIVRTQSRLLILKVIESTIFLGNTVKREGYYFFVFVQRHTILVIGLLSNLFDLVYEVNSLAWLFLKTKTFQLYDWLVVLLDKLEEYTKILLSFSLATSTKLQRKTSDYALKTTNSLTRFCIDAVDIIKNDAENLHELVVQVFSFISNVLLTIFSEILVLVTFIGNVHFELLQVFRFLLLHQLPDDIFTHVIKLNGALQQVLKSVKMVLKQVRQSKVYQITRREARKQVVKLQHLNYRSWVELSKLKLSLLKQNVQRKMSMRPITLNVSDIRFGVEHLELLKYTNSYDGPFKSCIQALTVYAKLVPESSSLLKTIDKEFCSKIVVRKITIPDHKKTDVPFAQNKDLEVYFCEEGKSKNCGTCVISENIATSTLSM